MFRKITIMRVNYPSTDLNHDLNEQLQYLGASLGLFSLRDKDKSCFRIFIILLRVLKLGTGLTSDELAAETGLSRGTVVYHLNTLMASGIVSNVRGRYLLAVDSLEALVEHIRNNLNKSLDDLKDVAVNLDNRLGL